MMTTEMMMHDKGMTMMRKTIIRLCTISKAHYPYIIIMNNDDGDDDNNDDGDN